MRDNDSLENEEIDDKQTSSGRRMNNNKNYNNWNNINNKRNKDTLRLAREKTKNMAWHEKISVNEERSEVRNKARRLSTFCKHL